MDIIVGISDNNKSWTLTDLLGRSMGFIAETSDEHFIIYPEGGAVATMGEIVQRSYTSLDAALAEIEQRTRGACRLRHDKNA